jgi:hypothetical protein
MPRTAAARSRPAAARPARAPAPRAARVTAPPSIIDAMNHPELFGPFFDGASWDGWKTILKAANGLPLNAAEVEFFHSIAGDRALPTGRSGILGGGGKARW